MEKKESGNRREETVAWSKVGEGKIESSDEDTKRKSIKREEKQVIIHWKIQ